MAGPEGLMSFLEIVVVDLYAEDDDGADEREEVGDGQGPVGQENALDQKEERAEAHEQECRHGYTLGVAGAYGVDGLRQIARHHADGGGISYDVDDCIFHVRVVCSGFFLLKRLVGRLGFAECGNRRGTEETY